MYQVRLSPNMLIALVDIASNYVERDSPRYHKRTRRALRARGLIGAFSLTTKGKAYLEMARYEYKTAEAALAA